MPYWGWLLIALGVVVVVALVVWETIAQRRTHRLRGEFGPEYERTVSSADSKRDAEADLAARKKRRQEFDIRPLSAEQRTQYTEEWHAVQAQFVDDPGGTVVRADSLIQSVMADRGYPVEDFEQRSADLSVDHPRVVENYREGHRLFRKATAGEGTTEDLRQAMRAYHKLFDELVAETAEADEVARDHDRILSR